MRKPAAIILICLMILIAVPAAAENPVTILPYRMLTVRDGARVDFDGDGTADIYSFGTDLDEWGDGSFTLSVNGQSVTQENCTGLADDVYVMLIGGQYSDGEVYWYASLFMVSEYGPSEDYYTYCYLYRNGTLSGVGAIPALARDFRVDSDTGVISTEIRASMIGTWYREARFILARGSEWDDAGENYQSSYHIAEVPQTIYPCGMIVTLKTALPLLECQTDTAYASQLLPGQQIIITATDDVRWAHVSSFDGDVSGWVRMRRVDYGERIVVGNVEMPINDVFGGIPYAD